MSQNQSVQPAPLPEIGLKSLMSPDVLGLVGLLLVIFLFLFIGNNGYSKNKTATARFANGREIAKARRYGKKQIRQGIYNQAAVTINDELVIPDAQRSIGFIGSAGSGKTESAISPSIDSAIEQGWTSLILDIKGTLMKRHAAYALANGYDVYVFAPGFPYSDSLNILDFMNGPYDNGMGKQIAHVINVNLKPVGSTPDAYFGPAGDALLTAIFMAARGSCFPDLLNASRLLALSDLAGRFVAAKGSKLINPWIRIAADGLMSVAGADDTVAGIVGSAVNNFGQLVDPLLLPSLMHSTIPLDLPGKQMIFFQMDEQREAQTSPLVAMAIHMLVTRNLNAQVKRDRPFFIQLDEFTSIRLPSIEAWINKNREYGQVLQLGYQSNPQMRMRYTSDYALSILGSLGTKFIFSPGAGNIEMAKPWSEACGKKEIRYKTTSSGGRGGNNRSEHVTQVPLVTADDITMFPPGECIIFNSVYAKPYRVKIKRQKKDLQCRESCVNLWNTSLRKRLEERASKNRPTEQDQLIQYLEHELADRAVYADMILPPAQEADYGQKEKQGAAS